MVSLDRQRGLRTGGFRLAQTGTEQLERPTTVFRSEAVILWKHALATPAVLALATDKAVHPWLEPKRLEKSHALHESSIYCASFAD